MLKFFSITGLLYAFSFYATAQESELCKGKSREDFENGIYLGFRFDSEDTLGENKKYMKAFFPDDETNLFYNLIYDYTDKKPYNNDPLLQKIKVYRGDLLNTDKRYILRYINSKYLKNQRIKKNELRAELFDIYDNQEEQDKKETDNPFAQLDTQDQTESNDSVRAYAVDQFKEFELFEKIRLENNKFKREQLFINIKRGNFNIVSNTQKFDKNYALDLLDTTTTNYLKGAEILVTNKYESFYELIKNGDFRGKLSFMIDGEGPQSYYYNNKWIFDKDGLEEALNEKYNELSFCINKIRYEIKHRIQDKKK